MPTKTIPPRPHGGAQVAPGLALVLGEVAAGVLDDRLVLLLGLVRRTRQLEHAAGAVPASLSGGGIHAQLFEHRGRAIELLRSAAAEISRTLGYGASLAA